MTATKTQNAVIMLTGEQISALKAGAVLTLENGISLIIDNGKAHIAKPSARVPQYKRVEMPVESGADVFRLTQEEATLAINAWKEGKLPIVVGRTAGKGESRSDIDSCSIKVEVWVKPKPNGSAPMESNGRDYGNWEIERIHVDGSQRYEIGEAVTIAKAIEEVTF